MLTKKQNKNIFPTYDQNTVFKQFFKKKLKKKVKGLFQIQINIYCRNFSEKNTKKGNYIALDWALHHLLYPDMSSLGITN